MVAVVHVGATLPPALVRTSPDEPADAVNCVLPMPNCHGIAPCVPPCKLVALVALVAVSAFPFKGPMNLTAVKALPVTPRDPFIVMELLGISPTRRPPMLM